MTQANILELAKKGDVQAIASLMNNKLQIKGITAKVTLKECCLHVILESTKVPNQQALVEFVRNGVTGLGIILIERIKISGQKAGDEFPAWIKEFELVSQPQEPLPFLETNITNKIYSATKNPGNAKFSNTGVQKREKSKSLKNFVDIHVLLSNEQRATTLTILFFVIAVIMLFISIHLSIFLFIIAYIFYQETPFFKAVKEKIKAEEEKKRLLEPKNQIITKGLAESNEQIIFYQSASYRGGIKGYPNQGNFCGYAFVLDGYFVFYDNEISWKLPYNKLIEAKLDCFQMEEGRALRALLSDTGRQLQETKNIVELHYLDIEGIERDARFQIHGASTIPGEAVKAREFLNHILEFKGKFLCQLPKSNADTFFKLEKLKEMKDKGLITESEFQAKKRDLLDEF